MAEIQKLIEALYEDHPTGGYLHIMLDDGNMDDGFLNFCEGEVNANKFNIPPEAIGIHRDCLAALRTMTEDERLEAYRLFHGHD